LTQTYWPTSIFLKKHLNFENGKLEHITRKYCAELLLLDQKDLNNRLVFVQLAFKVINNEVLHYKFLMTGGKRK
jgi:hypothetical protein